MQLEKLIDLASQVAGSDYKLAQALPTERQVISDWRAGRRTCTAEDRALLADIAGVDPIPEIVTALIERTAGKPKGERLAAILKERLEGVRNL